MTNIQLIQENLPENLREIVKDFEIADKFIQNIPDVIVLVLESKSLDSKQEKQSWFNLLPLMNDEQVDKLRDILTREKQKLAEIEEKYANKKDDMINKYVKKIDEEAYQDKITQIRESEWIHQERDSEEADALLDNL